MHQDKIKIYQVEAERIIKLLKKDFLLPSGALCLERTASGMFEHHIFPDLGDFLPFFLYFKEEDFVAKQIEIYKSIIKNGVLVSEFPSFGVSQLAKSYEYTDLLYGLISYYEFKNDHESRALLENTVKKATEMFNLGGRVSSFYSCRYHFRLPIFDTRDGTFIEIFTDLATILKDDKYIKIAKSIFDSLVSRPFFQKYGLLPTFYAPFWVRWILRNNKKFNQAELCKNNTNSLFGFLALYKITGDTTILASIDMLVDSIRDKAMINGGVVKTFYPSSAKEEVFLTSSFALMDFLCDLYFTTKKTEHLRLAETIANYWISHQGRTGLFPVRIGSRDSFFDSETDMIIALYKLFELTDNHSYYMAAERCLQGIFAYHAKHDYVLSVDCDTGEVTDSTQRTKFIALFLKLLILKIRMEEGDSIMSTAWLTNLLRDR